MKKMTSVLMALIACLFAFFACSSGSGADEPAAPSVTITLQTNALSFEKGSSSQSVTVRSNQSWTISSSEDWCTVSPNSGLLGVTTTVNVTLKTNTTAASRTAILTVTSLDKSAEETITVTQAAGTPSPNPDKTGMSSDAKQLAAKIVVGWNLGNSLESGDDTDANNNVSYGTGGDETSWGNPVITKELIDQVKAQGFNAVRIPVRWYNHVNNETDFVVDAAWMKRVKVVVDYVINNGMYAILNTHHELWMEYFAQYKYQAEIQRKETLLWTQIAKAFADYDEHLIFSGTNEVHLKGLWGEPSEENAAVQNSFNQTFVDAVRATGGKNAWRNLIVQCYSTNPEFALKYFTVPTDNVENRLMLEAHYYSPNDFCLEDNVKYWGKDYASYGISTYGQESAMDDLFQRLQTTFVEGKNMPIILGECGANHHSLTDETMIKSRAYFLQYLVTSAKNHGLVPFYWDNGTEGVGAETWSLVRRADATVYDQPGIDALMKGAAAGKYPF